MFTGTLKIKIIEAVELKPTAFQGRLNIASFSEEKREISIDPYVLIDLDEVTVHRWVWLKWLQIVASPDCWTSKYFHI